MIVWAVIEFLILVAASFITAPNACAFQPSSLSFSPHKSISTLFVGTGFSFNDGNQVLVSVQKPLGIILEQDDEQEGIIVAEMDTTGSAARADVQVGDVLVAVQNASMENQSLEYVLEFIGQAPQVVNLRFERVIGND